MNILYMGTPDFAVPPLQALIDAGHTICAAVTQPDRPKGRGYQLAPPPVKELALEHNIPVYQPESLKNGALLPVLEEYKPDLIAVVAYGRILPEYVLSYPKHGCINVHGSLLPKYRGAAPIQWAVINGEEITGVCSMYMNKGLDTGDVILTRETEIGRDETAEELFDRLAPMGAQVLVETVAAIEAGSATRTPQDDALATLAPPLNKEQARINWSLSAHLVGCHIRGCYSWPVAHTFCGDMRIRITRAKPGGKCSGKPGQVIGVTDAGMEVCAGDGMSVIISEFQPDGSRRMAPDAYFRGHPSMIGEILN